MGLTEELCNRIAGGAYEIGDREIAAAKRLMLDGIAVALAGSAEEPPGIVAEHVRECGGAPLASAFGFAFKVSPVQAAFLNGVSMHVLDFEAMWNPPTHPTSPTLPAVAAIAEMQRSSGRQAIVAFLKGCEIQGRMLLAARQYSPRGLNYHPPGVVGVMGAAVAAGHLLQLDTTQLRHALGVAASRAGALIANIGSMTKSTHCGLASSLGLEAAMLARRGFTANPDILESGYTRTFFGEIDEEALLTFGKPFRLVDPGVAIKRFPSQYGTHFGITAGLELHDRVGAADQIAAIEFRAPVMPYVDRPLPKNGLDGKFSLQYTLAAALLDGEVTIRTFTDERRFRDDMVAVLPKIGLIPDESIPSEFARMHVEATVRLTDGTSYSARCDGPKGLWGHAPISREEHMKKILDCLAVRLQPDRAERFLQLFESLETLNGAQMEDCWSLLMGAHEGAVA